MHVFYTETITPQGLLLSEEESRHAIKVLRLETGDEARVLDGKGNFYRGSLAAVLKKQCVFDVLEKQTLPQRKVQLTMAVSPTRQIDRFEWFLEKATELGVERIVPLITHHSERKVIKTERCRKILVSAMKQSMQAYLPEITETTSLKNFLKQHSQPNESRFIAHCRADNLPHLMHEEISGAVTVLIGPEGDFDESEVKAALAAGFKAVSLGNARLRTETAAIAAVHCVALKTL